MEALGRVQGRDVAEREPVDDVEPVGPQAGQQRLGVAADAQLDPVEIGPLGVAEVLVAHVDDRGVRGPGLEPERTGPDERVAPPERVDGRGVQDRDGVEQVEDVRQGLREPQHHQCGCEVSNEVTAAAVLRSCAVHFGSA